MLMKEGEKLTAYHIGLLASNGIAEVSVKRPLKIGLLSTGDELMELTEPLKEGKIYNSNLYTLSARLMELGCEPLIIGTIKDDVKVGVKRIRDVAPKVDMIITTGGVSVGKMDIMHPIIEELKADRLFWKITIKPGSPAIASVFNGKLILSLSGNPSAAATTFELFFRAILSTAMNCNELTMKHVKGIMAEDFKKKSPNRRLLRAYYKGGQVYLTKGNQSSGALMSMVGCNCFVDIQAGSQELLAETVVDVLLL
jgi:molybdopterin molybdotransferase